LEIVTLIFPSVWKTLQKQDSSIGSSIENLFDIEDID